VEGLKWGLDREALRRHPDADFALFYRAAPLRPTDRQLLAMRRETSCVSFLMCPFRVRR